MPLTYTDSNPSAMKANVLYAINDLRYTDYPLPKVKSGEVLVKVKACGICGSDIGRVFKTGTYHFPTIIGHEFAGVVMNPDGTEGRRVGVFPLKPCFDCNACREGKYEMCSNYDYLGSRCDGGFAQYVAVPDWNLIDLPDNVSFEQAAMLEPSAVAMHALHRFCSLKGKSLVIYGPGTIGNILVCLAHTLGVGKVMVVGRNDAKLNIARQNGASTIIKMAKEDAVARIFKETGGNGADCVIEGTGNDHCLDLAVHSLRGEGELVLMGNPQADMPLNKNTYWRILRKQLKVYGTWNSSFKSEHDDWKAVLTLISEGKYHPESLITHKFPMPELMQGLEAMRDPEILTNKVMIVNND